MKKLIELIIYFMFVGVISVFAEPLEKHTLELGTEISYIEYEEPGSMEERGVMLWYSRSLYLSPLGSSFLFRS